MNEYVYQNKYMKDGLGGHILNTTDWVSQGKRGV